MRAESATPTLWLRFAEDSALPPVLDAAGQQQLAAIFAPDNPQSLWCRSLQLLGLPVTPAATPLLRWYRHAPYINWSQMVLLVSGGSLCPIPNEKSFTYQESYRPASLWRMIKAQWRISRYVQDHTEPNLPLPDDNAAKLVESLALGFCVLALTMHIPSKNPTLLEDGLADINAVPKTFRGVVTRIKAVQRRRNLLSPAWAVLFKNQPVCTAPSHLPLFFWGEPPAEPEQGTPVATQSETRQWRGIPVAGTKVSGRAIIVRTAADEAVVKASSERLVLIFPLARPETTELFPYAAAVLYGAGGALCHACSIAREQNVTCITGLGQDFVASITAYLVPQPDLVVEVDPAQHRVTLA